MDKTKVLTKNPFKYQNKYDKEVIVFNKLIDQNNKVVDSEKDEKLLNSIEKVLLKTKDPIHAHIQGNVLNDLGYINLAELFFNKAIELGYIVEQITTTDNDIDFITNIIDNIKSKLDNQILEIESNGETVDAQFLDIFVDTNNVIIYLDNNEYSNISIPFNQLSKLLENEQIVMKNITTKQFFGLKIKENNMLENNLTNENYFYDNLDNLYNHFSDGYKPEEDPDLQDNIDDFINTLDITFDKNEVRDYLNMFIKTNDATLNNDITEHFTPGQKYSSDFDYDGMFDFALTIDENTPIETLKALYTSMVDVNYHDEAKELNFIIQNLENGYGADFDAFKHMLLAYDEAIKNGTFEAKVVESVGTINFEAEIAENLYPKIKAQKEAAGTYTVKQLENEIMSNGGSLEMTDNVMSYLVNMGIDFDNEIDESIDNNYEEYFLNKLHDFQVHSPTELTDEQWIEIDNGWTSKDESGYEAYFTNKLHDFQVHSPSELTDKQWEEIDNGWISIKEENGVLENHKQVLPNADVFKGHNIFSSTDVPTKPKYNISALKRLIEHDSFLMFYYNNTLTGIFENDMDLIYNTYIKNDSDYIDKMKTFESYDKMIKENSIVSSVFGTILEDIIKHFDIDLSDDKTDIVFEMSEFISQNKNKFKSYFALMTGDLKEEFRNKFSQLSYLEVADKLLESDFNIENQDIDNIKKISESFEVSEQLSLLILNVIKSTYNEYKYKTYTEDMNTNSILFMGIIAVVLNTIF